MRNGDIATLHIKKVLCLHGTMDDRVYSATVLQYDERCECIYFCLDSGKLTDVSLDAIYECNIQTAKEQLNCTGRIKERYCGRTGKIIRFEIENGFYKINVK